MSSKVGIVEVPFRFEGLRNLVGAERLSHVLLEMPEDLTDVKRLLVAARSARQGKMAFVIGRAGSGKTSLANSLPIYLADLVGAVITPPGEYEVSLGTLPNWLARNVRAIRPSAGGRMVVANLDLRETLPGDDRVTRDAMTNLNALLRAEEDLVVLWPAAQATFAEQLLPMLREVGGGSALGPEPLLRMRGLPQDRYFDALRLIVHTMGVDLADAAVTDDEVEEIIARSETIGDCLESVGNLVVKRYQLGELGLALPRLYIAVSSDVSTTDVCRQLCRGSHYWLDPDRTLRASGANVATDWRRLGAANAMHALPYIASLFEARLVSLSASAVVHACAQSTDSVLRDTVRAHVKRPISSNAQNAMASSALARALNGEEDVAQSASKPSEPVLAAYRALQRLSRDRHRQLNEAVVAQLAKQVVVPLGEPAYEYQPFADRGLRADAWVLRNDRPEALEFTYQLNLGEAKAASYVLGKLMDYARDYGLLG